jgi:hypothetical protein
VKRGLFGQRERGVLEADPEAPGFKSWLDGKQGAAGQVYAWAGLLLLCFGLTLGLLSAVLG